MNEMEGKDIVERDNTKLIFWEDGENWQTSSKIDLRKRNRNHE